MGVPAEGFSAMVYGLPKSGKSTFCLGFAHHLAAHHGNVLYCAVEEGIGYTLKEKIECLHAAHPRLFIAGQLPDTLEGFDFIFIDSVSKAGLDLDTLQEVREHSPTPPSSSSTTPPKPEISVGKTPTPTKWTSSSRSLPAKLPQMDALRAGGR
jgi:hypothetical protein